MTDHDSGYKWLFSDKRIVADLIRGFVNEPWVAQLDLETLERIDGSFVSDEFKQRENDVIWRVRIRGCWLYVYLLIEFQSGVDRFMALRLMVYVGLLYQRLLDEGRIARTELLPPVLPIVLYNGKQRWSAPLDVADLIVEGPEDLTRYRPRMRYFLLEEHAQEDTRLAGMENLAALVFRFEQCRTRSDFEHVVYALGQWARAPEHQESVKRLVRWIDGILWRNRVPDASILDLDDIRECETMLREQVKQWEQEAIQKGIERGKVEVLLRLLQQKFGPLSDKRRRDIDGASPEQLLYWAERILTAEQIEDVFEDK